MQKAPTGQAWHSVSVPSPLSLPKRPAGHESAALLLAGQNSPSPQVSQAVWPARPCIVPGKHTLQVPLPVVLATVPGRHGVGSDAASGHAWPLGQTVQLACAISPVALPYEPAEHGDILALTLPASHQ